MRGRDAPRHPNVGRRATVFLRLEEHTVRTASVRPAGGSSHLTALSPCGGCCRGKTAGRASVFYLSCQLSAVSYRQDLGSPAFCGRVPTGTRCRSKTLRKNWRPTPKVKLINPEWHGQRPCGAAARTFSYRPQLTLDAGLVGTPQPECSCRYATRTMSGPLYNWTVTNRHKMPFENIARQLEADSGSEINKPEWHGQRPCGAAARAFSCRPPLKFDASSAGKSLPEYSCRYATRTMSGPLSGNDSASKGRAARGWARQKLTADS
ncbi:hypothetical protein Pan189_25560 [Stratiformator vulcanicus]|uniref:Uncharacterized protein n=1 Tax=Stratiformator vulcanicus TaxID=2527980 RepID=A0A517R2Q2_9PLAN|nr:hypothetical protein Pan189_25560 [Stratiformator vulcanicus]